MLTPYGIAAVIALLAKSGGSARTISIPDILVLVMVLDLFAMLFARRVLVGVVPVVQQVLAAVLAILQLALSIQFIQRGLHDLRILPGWSGQAPPTMKRLLRRSNPQARFLN